MTNTFMLAKKELDILTKTTPDALILEFIPEILAICEAFGNSGQSGGSAPWTAEALASAVKSLCLHKPISPLTGEDSEWNEVTGGVLQNNRHSAVFKEHGRAYYLDAIVWDEQGFNSWTGKVGGGISSLQFIKAFPFEPKTFYVDVIEEQGAEGYTKLVIKDKEQLRAAAEYYAGDPCIEKYLLSV